MIRHGKCAGHLKGFVVSQNPVKVVCHRALQRNPAVIHDDMNRRDRLMGVAVESGVA